MEEQGNGKRHRIFLAIIVIVSILLIIGSIVAIVLNINHDDDPKEPINNGITREMTSEEVMENEKIVADINGFIAMIPQSDAVNYIDERAAEYKNANVGLPIAQMKMNMFYNAGEYEKAEEAGRALEDEYNIDEYPLRYQSDFYREMTAIYDKLNQIDKKDEYDQKNTNAYEEYGNGGGKTINVKD